MKCKICNSKDIIHFLNLGKQPLANKYPKNLYEIKNEKKFKLNLLFCKTCLSIQIDKIINRKYMFEDYYYLSSVNKSLVNHFNKLAIKLKNSNFVVDIGSNDGILLNALKNKNINCVGIDPSINVGKIANDKGLKTYIDFYNSKVIKKIIFEQQKKPDTLVASSIFTHIDKPIKFAENTKNFLSKNGLLIIEIEYLVNFLKNIEFERFYFDRPFYFSLNSIKKIFMKFDLILYDVEMINTHGGSARCFISNNKKIRTTKKLKFYLKEEKKYLSKSNIKDFNCKINSEIIKFKNKISKYLSDKKEIVGYGAPARVSTITNYLKINKNFIKYIIDDSPLKQNRFTPGMHIPIRSRKNVNLKKIDIVIVFAYEYFSDIKKYFNNKILFFRPIPFKKLR